MYDVWDYLGMLEDPVRLGAYARALRAQVRPDDVVLDLGCGVGAFGILAARCGARRVYGVEPTSPVAFATDLARANGVEDRCTWWRGRVEEVVFPEKPTLIVGDVRGTLPFYAGGLSAWEAARGALAAGGRTIPRRDTVLAVPVRSERLRRRLAGPVVEGLSLAALREGLRHQEVPVQGDEVDLAPAAPLFEIPYAVGRPLPWSAQAEFVAADGALPDAFALGFEADLGDGITYRSLGPGASGCYPVRLVPVAGPPSGATGARYRLRVRLEGGGSDPQLLWAYDVGDREGDWQGALAGEPLWLDVFQAGHPQARPGPDAQDDLDALLLSAFARGERVGEAVEGALRADARRDRALVEARAAALARRRQRRRARRLGDGA